MQMMTKRSGERRRAFSLIELMLVLTVVALLMAFAAPNLFSLMSSSSLTAEGTLLRNQLTLGQQLAVSKSADVEVRFFRMADVEAARTDTAFRAFQMFQYDEDGEMSPVSSFFRIKAPVAVSEKYSTLLDPRQSGSGDDLRFGFSSPRSGMVEVPIGFGGSMERADYVAFRFRPDGSTDLPNRAEGDTWYVTLVQGEGASAEQSPDNYVCLQLNPYNGKVSEFRP